MRDNFTCYNPTRIHFGKNVLSNFGTKLKNYGEKVLLIYGGDSIKICRLVLKNQKYMQSMYGM